MNTLISMIKTKMTKKTHKLIN